MSQQPSGQEHSSNHFPLAHGQRGFWFLQQLDPSSPSFHLSYAARILSPLNMASFEPTLAELTRRHAALRTTFALNDGDLVQRVHHDLAIPLQRIDATAWNDAYLREQLRLDNHRPFDLEKGPLIRWRLYDLSNGQAVFHLIIHHLIGDFLSLALLLEEIGRIYPALCEGRALAEPSTSATYRDFVAWQQQLIASPDGTRLGAWWQSQLADAPIALELPTDRPRPARLSARGGAVPCRLPAALISMLRRLAAEEQVTLFAVLLAGWQTLLARWSGQDDILVGCPFSGRTRREFEQVFGCFINMVPLRARLDGDPTFRTAVRQVGANAATALAHQDYPFPLIVQRLGIERTPGRTPLAQVTFAMERNASRTLLNQAGSRQSVGGIDSEFFDVTQDTAQTDLELVLEEGDGVVEGLLRFSADLYDEATAKMLVRCYRHLLGEAAADGEQRVSRLSLLDAEEMAPPPIEPGASGLLHEKFFEQAEKHPNRIAILSDEGEMTAGVLAHWAGAVAANLAERGCQPGELTAIALPRTPRLIAAELGVLLLGAAFVPIDPDTPAPRKQQMLSQGTIRCIFENENFPDGEAAPVARPTLPSSLAYAVFTSGSTGVPRAALIEHRNIANTIAWRMRALPLTPDDRVLLAVPPFFDPAISIVFHALSSGAALVLAAPGEEREPAKLLSRIERDRVTVLQMTPSLLRLLLEGDFARACRTVRWIACGGEPFPAELADRVRELLNVPIYNLYGPTEAAVEATYYQCQPGDTGTLPLGQAIPGTRAIVVDRHRQPVPVVFPGELLLEGHGVGPGYLGGETRPWSSGRGRAFLTGDRCRQRRDGVIEFLGRTDAQIKLRGYRIEPGEIEAALQSHPAIREAAVRIQGKGPNAALAGHLEIRHSVSLEELRDFLQNRLPAYMVPSRFRMVEHLPRTSTGKIDRAALPEIESDAARPEFESPVSDVESRIARIWQQSLKVDRVGRHDHFFELGGHSLQAALCVSRVSRELGQPINTLLLFEHPVLADFAQRCQSAPTERSLIVPLQPNGTGVAWWLVHPPGGIVHCYRELASALGDARPIFGIQSCTDNLPATLSAMAAEYAQAIRSQQPQGPYLLAGWSAGGLIALEIARQLEASPVVLFDTNLPGPQQVTDDAGREYGLDRSFEELTNLPADELLPYLWNHAVRLGLVASDTPAELVQTLLNELKRLFHHHVQLAEQHVVTPFAGQIILIRPTGTRTSGPEDRGWSNFASSVQVHWVSGQHHDMVRSPHAAEIAAVMQASGPQ